MGVKTKTKFGSIDISNEAIATTIADTVLACYGVVGLAKKSSVSDKVVYMLKKGNFSEGVIVSQDKTSVTIDVYLIVAYDVKITEVLREVQKRVKFITKKAFALDVKKANIYAHSLKKVG